MADIFDQYVHPKTEVKPIIYAYSDTRFPGCLKVGYTDRPIEVRMHEHYPTLTPGQSYKVEYVESALNADGAIFMDHDVHRMLEAHGFHAQKSPDGKKSEWYKCSVDDVKAAILAVKTSSLNLENRTQNFRMRPEQARAVRMTKAYFESKTKRNPNHTAKFLWNAKMRFGKTFTSYELAKAMDMKRVLILTFKPAVEESWETDLLSHMDFEGWQFYSREVSQETGIRPQDLDQSKPIVCFGSFQDFLGTNAAGGIKAKNEWVHTTNWDLVIFDEYHFGAWRENAKHLFEKEDEDSYDDLDIDKYKKDEADNAVNEDFLPITTKYYLFLSGTPFRALNTGEFMEDQIFSWTYSDEQKAKENWDDNDGPNPYASMPEMVMMTYRIPDEIRRIAYNEDFNEFDLNVFFAAKPEVEGHPETAQFVYKDYVQKWLSLIRGAYMPSTVDDLKLGQNAKPVMPYSDARMLSVLNHTLWFLPNVASCYAMANLLAEKQNVFYHDYTVNVCAGTAAGVGLAALEPVRESMDPPLETKTITLSCGKLTTGVTIKPWTGIFMLRNLSSPETYFQAAFRVQSPWTVKKEDGTEEILKENCYIFDFALDRALRQISDYSCRLNISESNPEKKVGDFIHFLPVLAFDGSTMTAVSASDILDITMAGTSATLLARRWESALLVNVDNETLQRLLDSDEAMKAIMNIEGFRSLNKDIETIINKSNAVKKAKAEKGDDMTPKEKKELSQEEKEYKSKRKEIQEKLIKFATRIPIFMYLTDFREYSLKDVITQFEPGLFKKVTGLTVEDFELLVSLGIFNDSLMNSAVYNFKRYEDASLEYTGISKHAEDEDVGLFSTVISKDEYKDMASAQTASMQENPFKKTVIIEQPIQQPKPAPAKPKVVPINQGYSVPGLERGSYVAEKPAPYDAKPKFKEVDLSKFRVGTIVTHKKYGEGKVTGIKSGKVMVSFDVANKTFLFPDAIEKGFLTVKEW